MAARIHLRLENLLLVFNKAMLPFLLQSPFPKNMCIGTFVQSRSKAFTKFPKGPEIQESNKYWDAAENKPNVCGPCSHGTSISSARMWRKERERQAWGSNPFSSDSRTVQRALRPPKTHQQQQQDRAKVQWKPQFSKGDPTQCHAYPCPAKTRRSIMGKAGWRLHLDYSETKTRNSQGGHALTHKVLWLELVS